MEKELKINFEIIEDKNSLNAIENKLYNAAMEARTKAYAVYSNFWVGCAILLENGEVVTGSNQENAAYPTGSCAERTAIFWASANYPNMKIEKLFGIGAPPCGNCRQTILEYEVKQDENIEIYFASLDGEIYKTKSIRSLLPFSFDASYL
jgi:cytidine deaminase